MHHRRLTAPRLALGAALSLGALLAMGCAAGASPAPSPTRAAPALVAPQTQASPPRQAPSVDRERAARALAEEIYAWNFLEHGESAGARDIQNERRDDFTAALLEPMLRCETEGDFDITLNAPVFTFEHEPVGRYAIGLPIVRGNLAVVPVGFGQTVSPDGVGEGSMQLVLKWTDARWRIDDIGRKFSIAQEGGRWRAKVDSTYSVKSFTKSCVEILDNR